MKTAGVVGFLGVALGAFGAHGLKGTVPDEMLDVWKTGVLYHLVHAVFLLVVTAPWPRRLALVGIGLFSGSLYAMTLSGVKVLGAITPLGGLCFLAAWALLVTRRWGQASPGST